MAIIDCCTREIVAWHLELRCRAEEAYAVVDRAAALHGIQPGEVTSVPTKPEARLMATKKGSFCELRCFPLCERAAGTVGCGGSEQGS